MEPVTEEYRVETRLLEIRGQPRSPLTFAAGVQVFYTLGLVLSPPPSSPPPVRQSHCWLSPHLSLPPLSLSITGVYSGQQPWHLFTARAIKNRGRINIPKSALPMEELPEPTHGQPLLASGGIGVV